MTKKLKPGDCVIIKNANGKEKYAYIERISKLIQVRYVSENGKKYEGPIKLQEHKIIKDEKDRAYIQLI